MVTILSWSLRWLWVGLLIGFIWYMVSQFNGLLNNLTINLIK